MLRFAFAIGHEKQLARGHSRCSQFGVMHANEIRAKRRTGGRSVAEEFRAEVEGQHSTAALVEECR